MSSKTFIRRFEIKNEGPSKFWEISVSGKNITVRYGKVGTNGQTQLKICADVATAKNHAQKLIISKTAKGYMEVMSESKFTLPIASLYSKSSGRFNFSKKRADYIPELANLTPDKETYRIHVGDTVDIFKKIFGFNFKNGKVIKIIGHISPVEKILRKLKDVFYMLEKDDINIIKRLYPLWGQRYCRFNVSSQARSCIVEVSGNVAVNEKVTSWISKHYPNFDIDRLANSNSGLVRYKTKDIDVKLIRINENHFSATIKVRSLLDGDSVLSTKAIEKYNWKSLHGKIVENVAWSDDIIPIDVLNALNSELDLICECERKDYHPRSKKVVRDIVHPSLYCYVKGVSKARNSPLSNYTVATKNDRFVFEDTDFWGRKYENSDYQWLPAEFVVDDNGNVLINSYINNLDKDRYPGVYDLIARIFGDFVPMFESVCGALRNDFYDENKLSEEISIPLRNRKLQVVTKLVEYRVNKEENFDGVWHVEGMSHENIIATGLLVLKRDRTFKGAEISFKRYLFEEEGDQLITNTPQNANRPTEMMDGGDVRPLGTMSTPYGRALVFPNSHIHKLSNMSSSDGEDAVRRILVFWLVNPETPIVSTANVEKQQNKMSFGDAKKYQLALMKERRLHKEDFNEREVYLCEH